MSVLSACLKESKLSLYYVINYYENGSGSRKTLVFIMRTLFYYIKLQLPIIAA